MDDRLNVGSNPEGTAAEVWVTGSTNSRGTRASGTAPDRLHQRQMVPACGRKPTNRILT